MSWHYLRGQEGESSEDICSGGEQLQPLKSKTTHAEFYCNGKLTDAYLDSLSGTTCEPSTGSRGAERSMSSALASRVKTSAPPGRTITSTERGPGCMVQSLVCGKKFLDWLRSVGVRSCGSKTLAISELKACTSSCKTLTPWGITRDGVSLGLGSLALTTSETGCGYLPTPTRHNSKEGAYPAEYRRKTPTLAAQIGGKINPEWNELRMGWPIKWTDLRPLATAKMEEWRHSHGAY